MEREKEQDKSYFIFPEKFIIPTSTTPSSYNEGIRYRTSPNQKSNTILAKALARAYQTLDTLAGEKSYFLFKKSRKVPQDFERVIKFLSSQGIIESVSISPMRYNDAPAFFSAMIHAAYPPDLTDAHPERVYGYGFGKNTPEVLSKTIGEFLERYFLTIYRNKDLLVSAVRSMKEKNIPFLDPALFIRSSEKQRMRNHYQYQESSTFRWEKAFRVSTGEKLYIPAQLIYWNYIYINDPPESFLGEQNTNACGGMFSQEEATLSALYELVERDAFLIYWLNKLAPPRIVPETVPDEQFQEILRETRRYQFEVHCLNTTLDTKIPSFSVFLIDSLRHRPYLSVGCGSRANPAEALRQALKEAWATYHGMRATKRESFSLPEKYKPFNDHVLGREERMLLWANPDMAPHIKFFTGGEIKKYSEYQFEYPGSFPNKKEELKMAVAFIEKLGPGYEVYAFLKTHPILTALSYHVARVIVPKLVPLYLIESHAPLGAERFKEIHQKFDFRNSQFPFYLPHPLP